MEDEVKSTKSRLEEKIDQQRINDAQKRARESKLTGRLQTELAKLKERNDRLDTLEWLRFLGRRKQQHPKHF